ncbi:MAG: hypothetical protein CMM00_06250 [Rhodopirellula sp.]|nr:hypothetical protein [Rhodopirellula sp.]
MLTDNVSQIAKQSISCTRQSSLRMRVRDAASTFVLEPYSVFYLRSYPDAYPRQHSEYPNFTEKSSRAAKR